MFFLTQLMHPSFVYGAKIYPVQDAAHLIIATVCFDQKVRLWQVRTLGGDIYNQQTDCIEMSILEKPLKTLGQKHDIDIDQLDDEAL